MAFPECRMREGNRCLAAEHAVSDYCDNNKECYTTQSACAVCMNEGGPDSGMNRVIASHTIRDGWCSNDYIKSHLREINEIEIGRGMGSWLIALVKLVTWLLGANFIDDSCGCRGRAKALNRSGLLSILIIRDTCREAALEYVRSRPGRNPFGVYMGMYPLFIAAYILSIPGTLMRCLRDAYVSA